MNDSMLNEEEKEEIKEVPKNKSSLIIFTKINKYYSVLFICPIICMLTNYISKKINQLNIINQPYFFTFITVELSYILAGLFYFVSYLRKNSNRGKESQ